MLRLLLDINHAIDGRFNKRLGLKKRIYSIITEAMMNTRKENIVGLFSQGSIIDKELISLFVSYKKNYNLNTQTMTDICRNAIHIIDNLCYTMNERSVYCSNLYNDINHQKFVNNVLAEAFKDD